MLRTALLSLLVLLGACAPAVQPPLQPYVFNTDYDTLFDATLQAVASTRVSTFSTRVGFALDTADRDTGLITALRLGRGRVVGAVGADRLGLNFRNGSLSFGFSSPGTVRDEQTLLSVVVRPAGTNAASLAYSTTAGNSADLKLADRFIVEVVQALLAEFGTSPTP